jgi:hypothetical protein
MSRFTYTTLALVFCLLPACALLNSDDSRISTSLEGRQAWQALDTDSYTFTYVRSCECLPEMAGPFDVTVRRGVVTEVSYEGSPVDPASRPFYTIEALFDLIQEASEQNADRINVAYHPVLGYPTEIYIDYERNAADEEDIITVTAFEQ